MTYIDIHSHIAWGIDDGLSTPEETKQAIKIAADDGISKIMASPHIIPGMTKPEDLALIKRRLMEVRDLAADENLEVIAGSEVMINTQTLDSIYAKEFIPVEETNYILTEFNVRNPWFVNRQYNAVLSKIQMAGYKPIIPHVERYFDEGIDWNLLEQWIVDGFVIQINATSLLGKDLPYAKKNAWKILQKGYAHIIATDTHEVMGSRIPVLSKAHEKISRKIGQKQANLLFYENPGRILEGQEVIQLEPVKRKRFFGFLK